MGTKNNIVLLTLAVIAIFSLMATGCNKSAALTFGALSGPMVSGGEVSLPIAIDNGGRKIAGLQFDLLFDQAALTYVNAAIGESGRSANKVVSARILKKKNDTLRVIIYATDNKYLLPNGTVANFTFKINENLKQKNFHFHFKNIIAKDDGSPAQSVPCKG